MHAIGEPVPESRTVTSLPEAWDFAQVCGFPLIIRPAYTLGGSGGGVARHEDEFSAAYSKAEKTVLSVNPETGKKDLVDDSPRAVKAAWYAIPVVMTFIGMMSWLAN